MLCAARPALIAQQMQHSAPSVPSTQLTIRTYEGKTLTLSPNELAALPHKSVVVFNAHNKANETYSGVPLADLLSKAGVPLGESVRGKLFMTGSLQKEPTITGFCIPWLKLIHQYTQVTSSLPTCSTVKNWKKMVRSRWCPAKSGTQLAGSGTSPRFRWSKSNLSSSL
jgi:hypothetical protein